MNRIVIGLSLMGLFGMSNEVAAQIPGSVPDTAAVLLRQLTERINALEKGTCPAAVDTAPARPEMSGSAAADSLMIQLWRLDLRVRRLASSRCRGTLPTDSTSDDLAALRAAATAIAGDTTSAPVEFVGRQRDGSALNPEISATGDVRFVYRDPGPQSNNAVVREFEFAFQSALDPFSHTKVFMTFTDEEVGVEEGYIYWTGLPGRLRVDAGKIRQQVGELNRWHLHALPETDYPLVYQRFLGDEGLAGVGLSLYTALPVSIAGGTHEAYLQATSAESEPLFGNSRQLSLLGRIQNFWQVSRSVYMQLGVTGVGGNNRELDLKSRLIGGDFRVTYRPPHAGPRREITFRAEGYRLHAAEADAVTNRYGAFADLQYRADQRWVFGTRFDWAEAARGPNSRDWQVIPAVTWWQSEFVYLRLEGRHGRIAGATQSQLLAQVVWAMGPHKHETY